MDPLFEELGLRAIGAGCILALACKMNGVRLGLVPAAAMAVITSLLMSFVPLYGIGVAFLVAAVLLSTSTEAKTAEVMMILLASGIMYAGGLVLGPIFLDASRAELPEMLNILFGVS